MILNVIVTSVALGAVAGVAWYGGYLWGRGHALQSQASAALGAVAGLAHLAPTAVLVPEPAPGDCPTAFAAHLYRVMPDPAAQAVGHDRGLVVWLDDATAALSDELTEAYAVGRADQGEADRAAADPEQADATGPDCTGLTATWCPIHGDCSCPRREHDGGFDHLNDPDCPLHGIYSEHADQDPLVDDDPEPDPDDEPDLRECWGCTADRPATDDPCPYCQTPASRWTVGEQVTGHRHNTPGRHGQLGTVERVGHHNSGAPYYHVRWPDTSGRGTLADGPYGQRELADPE